MYILAADTATRSCSVAITNDRTLVAEITFNTPQTHSRHLMPMVAEVIRMAGLRISDMDVFAATRGPGSFTGLRIGLSTLQGMATAAEKPVVGVSVLDLLAKSVGVTRRNICPMIDARKGEVYYSFYRAAGGELEQTGPARVGPARQVLEESVREPHIFCGSGARLYQEMISGALGSAAFFGPPENDIIRAGDVALRGLELVRQGCLAAADALLPQYIRKSDAELNFQRSSP